MSDDVKFWDKTAYKYSLKPVPSEDIYEEKLKKTQKLFTKNSLVMEFGCGTGTTSLIHAPFVRSIKAFDFSPEMIKIANEKKDVQGVSNVDFEVKGVDELDFASNSFNIVMGHSILHLTFDNEKILKKVFEFLKPGGYFVSSSGCMKDMPLLLRIILPILEFFKIAPPINYFSADELVQLHEKCGFQIVEDWRYKKGELFLIVKKP